MRCTAAALLLLIPAIVSANPPSASYIFPAGGQRGAKVNVRVGGLFLHEQCGFEMLGVGVTAPKSLKRTSTLWFEGPILPLPDSQRQEDYPKDMAGQITIAPDAAQGVRYWRLWTSQGATPSLKFMVGDLPEVVEEEIDGDPIPVQVKLPVTINGRIFPREDIDIWTFQAKKGQTIRCEVHAARLGSPLDARLEVRDPQGRRIAENDDYYGADPVIAFTAPADGMYQVHIQDTQAQGGQAYVYRLTLTAEPFVERVYPLGGRRGSSVDLAVFGQNVPARLQGTIPAQAGPEYAHFFTIGTKTSNPVLLDVDDLPEFLEKPDSVGQVANLPAINLPTITLPAILNGRIEKPGKVSVWKWQGRKGDVWEFELRAARLGSRLDGVVTICDGEGKTLAKAEASPLDPSLRYQVPADGEYFVQVQDRFRSRGGPEFAYRLRIAPPGPADFRLWLAGDAATAARNNAANLWPAADALSVPRKGTAKLKINVERLGGFKDPITLEVQGLPANVTVAGTTINPNQASIDLTFKADEQAKIGVSRLTIVGKAKELQRQARVQVGRGAPELAQVLFAVALPTPFVIKGEYDMGFAVRGGIHRRKYKIERNGFEGPIEVRLADKQARHLQGVEGPSIVVPAGASEFTYAAYLPPWMETGRTCRVCVMGVGVIKEPDGSEHRVSFSSVNQNEQLVAVVGPGKLAMETERTSYAAEPGKQFIIRVRIKRGQDVEGPVHLELIASPHLRGLTAAKTTIAAKEEQGQLIVTCAGKMDGPFNMPVLVKATLLRNGEPIVAEVRLDVQP